MRSGIWTTARAFRYDGFLSRKGPKLVVSSFKAYILLIRMDADTAINTPTCSNSGSEAATIVGISEWNK